MPTTHKEDVDFWINEFKEGRQNTHKHFDSFEVKSENESTYILYEEQTVRTLVMINGKPITYKKDVPSIIETDGETSYWLNGVMHREDGPARITKCSQTWFKHGKKHREDGPAMIDNDCSHWYINDRLHRLDGPALENKNGSVAYYIDGKPHRIGGPALILHNGYEEYWENGIKIK